jgi:hypothetical protein
VHFTTSPAMQFIFPESHNPTEQLALCNHWPNQFLCTSANHRTKLNIVTVASQNSYENEDIATLIWETWGLSWYLPFQGKGYHIYQDKYNSVQLTERLSNKNIRVSGTICLKSVLPKDLTGESKLLKFKQRSLFDGSKMCL